MTDRFTAHSSGLNSPALHGFTVTPNDDADLAETTRALFIGGAGAIRAVFPSGAEVTFSGLASGTVLPVRIARIKATGTTATAIVGLV